MARFFTCSVYVAGEYEHAVPEKLVLDLVNDTLARDRLHDIRVVPFDPAHLTTAKPRQRGRRKAKR